MASLSTPMADTLPKGSVVSFIPDFMGRSVTASVYRRDRVRNCTEYRISGLAPAEMAAMRTIMCALYPTLRVDAIQAVDSIVCSPAPQVRQVLDPTEVLAQLHLVRFVARRVEKLDGEAFSSAIPIMLHPDDPSRPVDPLLRGTFEIRADARHTAGEGLRVYTSHVRFVPNMRQRDSGIVIEPLHYPSETRARMHAMAVGGRLGQFLFHVPHGSCVNIRFTVGPGVGMNHARWSPMGYSGFRRVAGRRTVEIDDAGDERDEDLRKTLAAHCPGELLDIEDIEGIEGKGKRRLVAIDGRQEDCTSCGLCKRLADQHTSEGGGAVFAPRIKVRLACDEATSMSGSGGDFIFQVGTEGEIECDTAMAAGMRMLQAASRPFPDSDSTLSVLEDLERRRATFEQDYAMLGAVGFEVLTPDMCRVANEAYK